MICPDCRGRGWTPHLAAMDDDEAPLMAPCETCGGSGVASSSDTAAVYITASNQEKNLNTAEQSYVCPGCGAVMGRR